MAKSKSSSHHRGGNRRQLPRNDPRGVSREGSVLVVYAHPGEVCGQFHDSILNTLITDLNTNRHIVASLAMTSGPRIASIRNQLTQKFLDHPAKPEWLWMLDSDMVFDYGDLLELLEVADPVERPIVGGLCFGGRSVVFPTLYRLVDPKENNGNVIQVITDFPDNALVKVDATGAACLFIHRSVLEKVQSMFPAPHHWFSESVYGGMEFGEDWTFCLRAAQAGYPIYVHTGVQIGHVKPRVIGIEDFRAARQPVA